MSTTTQAPGAESVNNANTPATNAQAIADARKAERERISAITTCVEAKDKSKLASHLATSTDMSLEDAKAILSAAASEVQAATPTTAAETPKPAATDSAFKDAMSGGSHPNVGVETQETETNTDKVAAHGLLRDHALATGKKLN